MKNLKQIMIVTAIAISGFLFMACEKEDEMMATPIAAEKNSAEADENIIIGELEQRSNVLDLVVENEKFEILGKALEYAGLAETVATIENITVFAPTNEAFMEFMQENDFRALEDIPVDVLTSVLLYHTVGETLYSRSLTDGYYASLSSTTAGYPLSLYVVPSSGKINAGTNIIDIDLRASNGVVHTIDKVLMPPTIVNHALNNPAFTVLVDAVVKAGLVETLSSDGPFTVFAPTNDAFYALFDELGFNDDIDDIPVVTLTKVLLSHVVAGNVTSDMVESGYVQTLNENKSIMISVTDGGVTIDEDINVILTDVQGTNGVIHVIDGVILPAIPTAERDYTDM